MLLIGQSGEITACRPSWQKTVASPESCASRELLPAQIKAIFPTTVPLARRRCAAAVSFRGNLLAITGLIFFSARS
jgi:hypothetical protein